MARLREAKLAALVQGGWGPGAATRTEDGPARVAGPLPVGATLRERSGGRGWVLDDHGNPAALGAALAWAQRRRVTELHVLVDGPGADGAAGIMARRAAGWAVPATVWRVDGRQARPVTPAPVPAVIEPPAAARALAAQLVGHGAEVVVEHGVITAEVLGLEVARIVPAAAQVGWFPDDRGAGGAGDRPGDLRTTGADDGWRIAVGVGHHDQEAREEMHPGEPVSVGLQRVVALVREMRTPAARRHPANTLARERWIRALVMAQPELVGARALLPVPPALPRHDLRLPAVAPAFDPGGGRRAVMVVCSVGVDLDLVPTAADLRTIHRAADDDPAGIRLVLVVPEGDDYPVTRNLAAGLVDPAEVVVVPRSWVTA